MTAYASTVEMMDMMSDRQLEAMESVARVIVSSADSPFTAKSEEEMFERIDHSLSQIEVGKVSPAKEASQRIRMEYGL